MNHHVEYYAKKKRENYDKSTVYDGSTEEPQDHPNFPKPKTNRWFNVIAIPACIWAALAWINAQYNIGQGDLKLHSWELMNAATAILFMYWSAKLFAWIINVNYSNKRIGAIAGSVAFTCFITFVSSGLYLVKIIIELFIK